MKIRKSAHPCNLFIHLRIIFHRTGAQRIESSVHPIVPLRETREVPDHVHLAELRESRQFFPQKLGGNHTPRVGPFDIPAEFRRALAETFFGDNMVVAEPHIPGTRIPDVPYVTI